jgi:hypothetical protein
MPTHGRVAEHYTKPSSKKWVCPKTKCRYYKKDIPDWKRGKFTGCHKHINTWQCPKWMAKDWY